MLSLFLLMLSGVMMVLLLSPCCASRILFSRGDGVNIGSCSVCNTDVIRMNPLTGREEWLDGNSPWTRDALRAVVRCED